MDEKIHIVTKKRNLITLLLVFFSILYLGKSEIVLEFPTEKDTVFLGSTINLKWENSNNIPVDLFYTTDNGQNWILIDQNILADNYDWRVPYLGASSLGFKLEKNDTLPPVLLLNLYRIHQNEIRSVRFSPDGNEIISAGSDEFVKIHDAVTGSLIDSFSFEPYGDLFFADYYNNKDSADFARLGEEVDNVIASGNNVFLWDRNLDTLKQLTFDNFQTKVSFLAIHPDRSLIAASSYDGLVKIFDLDGNILKSYDVSGNPYIYNVQFSKNGRLIAYSTSDGRIIYHEWEDGNTVPFVLKGHGDGMGNLLSIWSIRSPA